MDSTVNSIEKGDVIMARQTTWSDGEKITAARLNECRDDYLSQSDPAAQSIASDVTIAGDLVVSGSFTFSCSGSITGRYTPGNPITVAHGLGGTPDNVVYGVKGAQPYACGWDADGTNIYFYPNTAAEITISYIAW